VQTQPIFFALRLKALMLLKHVLEVALRLKALMLLKHVLEGTLLFQEDLQHVKPLNKVLRVALN
jgi:hypothetical protein